MKACYVCKKTKPLSEFSKNCKEKDGKKFECKSCVADWVKTPSAKVSRLYSACVRRAKLSKSEVTITREWLLERINKGVCELTGLVFNFDGRGQYSRQPYAPSIDRIDPQNKNYTPENCRVVLWAVNCSMAEYGDEIMIPIFEKIVEYAKQNKLTSVPTQHTGEGQDNTQLGTVHGAGPREDCDGAHHHTGESEGQDASDSTEAGCRICMGTGVQKMATLATFYGNENNGDTLCSAEEFAKRIRCLCYQP
jgi:hypothetical protein